MCYRRKQPKRLTTRTLNWAVQEIRLPCIYMEVAHPCPNGPGRQVLRPHAKSITNSTSTLQSLDQSVSSPVNVSCQRIHVNPTKWPLVSNVTSWAVPNFRRFSCSSHSVARLVSVVAISSLFQPAAVSGPPAMRREALCGLFSGTVRPASHVLCEARVPSAQASHGRSHLRRRRLISFSAAGQFGHTACGR
jgi:hypothetical protein